MVFLAQPTYDFKLDARAVNAVNYEIGKVIRVTDPRAFSLIPPNFNASWCECLNRRKEFGVDYFMMLHADIMPELGFAEKMVAEMQSRGADLLSAVIPFKNNSGLTSTALNISESLPRRLTLKEIVKLPETFDLSDCQKLRHVFSAATHLLVNSGLMIVRLDFVESLGRDKKRLYFFERDWLIEEKDGKLSPRVISEDWNFSQTVADLGGKVMATRKIKATHLGPAEYRNAEVWGKETDN